MKQKITIFGVGRLGLSFALLLNSKGYDVCGCDVNENYIESLKDKTFTSKEPGIDELLKDASVEFTTDATAAFNYSDLIFVFVPTPSNEGGDYDHHCIDQIVSKIEKGNIRDKTLIIGCTVMPGYCKSIQEKLFQQQINVLYNPEFIAQGSIVGDLINADIVLIGGENMRMPKALGGIYRAIMAKKPNFKTLSLTGAEIAKISINCFLSMKVAFANLIGEVIINSSEYNIHDILDAIGSDSRVGNKYLSYGFPPGGPCIPRDQKALGYHANSVLVDTKFTHAVDYENNRHSEYLTNYYIKQNPDNEIPFKFSSLSYKKGTDILTESYPLKLCIELLAAGYKVDVPASAKDLFFNNDKVSFGEDHHSFYKIN